MRGLFDFARALRRIFSDIYPASELFRSSRARRPVIGPPVVFVTDSLLKSSFQSSSFRLFPLIFVPSFPLFCVFPSWVAAQGWTFLWRYLGVVRSVFGRVTVFFFFAICFVHFTSSERVVLWRTFIYFRATHKISLYNRYLFSFKHTIRFKMV